MVLSRVAGVKFGYSTLLAPQVVLLDCMVRPLWCEVIRQLAISVPEVVWIANMAIDPCGVGLDWECDVLLGSRVHRSRESDREGE
ncbi:hypothetical protein Tco_1418962 [Tanacetum coccineum]